MLSIDNSTDAFDLVESFTSGYTVLTVPANDIWTARFPIVPQKLGYIPIKVTARSNLESDTVLRMLLVEVCLIINFSLDLPSSIAVLYNCCFVIVLSLCILVSIFFLVLL